MQWQAAKWVCALCFQPYNEGVMGDCRFEGNQCNTGPNPGIFSALLQFKFRQRSRLSKSRVF